MNGRVVLVGSNVCPTCGRTFRPTPPLEPNVEDREFYGGRISFFKNVVCDCQAEYRLCIEKKFNSKRMEDELTAINMIILKKGRPLEEIALEKLEQKRAEEAAQDQENIEKAIEAGGEKPILSQRKEIKKQQILATIIDKDEKLATLMLHTHNELRVMCKRRKLKCGVNNTKKELAETLLAYDPNMVVANPEG